MITWSTKLKACAQDFLQICGTKSQICWTFPTQKVSCATKLMFWLIILLQMILVLRPSYTDLALFLGITKTIHFVQDYVMCCCDHIRSCGRFIFYPLQSTVEGSLFQHKIMMFPSKFGTCHLIHSSQPTCIPCGNYIPAHVKMK